MKQIFEIEQEFEESTPSMGLNSSIIKHLLFSYYKDRSTHLINFAVPEIKVKEVTFFPPKKQVTVDIEGKEFEQAVRKIADEVRVKAERRNLKSKRLYTAWSYYDRVCTCNSDPCVCSTFHNPDEMEFVDKEDSNANVPSKAAEKDYAEMMSKSQQGAPFDEYGYDKMKAEEHYSFVHPTAIIDKGVMIGKGTQIWHNSHICTGACIGEHCTIGDNVYIGVDVYIGYNCKIQNNVYIPEGVIINDNVFIGPCATFTNIKHPDATVSQKGNFKQTFVRNNATIGANATILCGIEIGAHSIVGAGSVVTKSVGDYTVVAGNPAEWMQTISKER